MSIGGDLVGEVIALLQPIYGRFNVNIREYAGELDDMDKDNFVLPTTLYVATLGTEGHDDDEPVSTILIEYNGTEHEPQDGSNLIYLSTFRVNVWVVAGYWLSLAHKEGGGPLQQDRGYNVYDAVLDLMAGRKLLKDAETLRLGRGERVYFGNEEYSPEGGGGDPWGNDTVSASVYKMEFTVKAQSVWETLDGTPLTPSGQPWYGTPSGQPWYGATAASPMPPRSDIDPSYLTPSADPWFLGAGPVIEDGSGFEVGMEVSLYSPYVDFSTRSLQHLPVDRPAWRSAFPGIAGS
jgi:hypothetical protein